MSKKLIEALEIQDAEFIGTAKGYDLFDVKTYAAAQQFMVENTATRAGQAYIQSENTFNTNINENQHLYFFVEENTNKVFAGVVKSPSTYSTIEISGRQKSVNIDVNFLFETNSGSNRANKVFPFFLIPEVDVSDCIRNMIIKDDSTLLAVLPQLTPETTIDLGLSVRQDIIKIETGAFDYGMHINILTLGDNIEELPKKAFDNVDHIIISWIEKPAGWDVDWDSGYENNIEYLNAEEIENIKNRKEQEAEVERQRQAELEQQRIEQEKQQLLSTIRYKKEGKAIVILGVKSSAIGTLIIPETIDGFPVTKIAPFAFYQNKKLDSVVLPNSIKEIGQGAFAYTRLEKIDIPAQCVVNKNAFFGTTIRQKRRY